MQFTAKVNYFRSAPVTRPPLNHFPCQPFRPSTEQHKSKATSEHFAQRSNDKQFYCAGRRKESEREEGREWERDRHTPTCMQNAIWVRLVASTTKIAKGYDFATHILPHTHTDDRPHTYTQTHMPCGCSFMRWLRCCCCCCHARKRPDPITPTVTAQ